MRMLKTLLLIVILLFLIMPMQKAKAQYNEFVDEAVQVVAKKIDQLRGSDISPYAGGEYIDAPTDLPEAYSFDWRYRLELSIGEQKSDGEFWYDYYLNPDAPYFSYTTSMTLPVFTVVDKHRDAKIAYLQENGPSVAMSYEIPEAMASEAAKVTQADEITELTDKEFLGYTTKGAQIDKGDSKTIIYITTEARVNFLEFTPGRLK